MKRLKSKLRSRRGETLVEAMASFLIVVLSGVFLAGMIMTAAKMNRNASVKRDALTTSLNAAETGAGPTQPGTVTITWDSDGEGSNPAVAATQAVTFTGAGADAPFTSYSAPAGGGG